MSPEPQGAGGSSRRARLRVCSGQAGLGSGEGGLVGRGGREAVVPEAGRAPPATLPSRVLLPEEPGAERGAVWPLPSQAHGDLVGAWGAACQLAEASSAWAHRSSADPTGHPCTTQGSRLGPKPLRPLSWWTEALQTEQRSPLQASICLAVPGLCRHWPMGAGGCGRRRGLS